MTDEILDVELDVVKEAFYPALKSQLIHHVGECDTTLFEYIVLLISNKRTKTHIVNDLQAFFNDAATEFTQWLWDFLKPFEKQEAGAMSEAIASHDDKGPKEKEAASTPKLQSENGKKTRRDSFEQENGDEPAAKSPPTSTDRRSASPKEKRTKPSGHMSAASRLFGSALSKKNSDGSRRKSAVVKKEEESPEEDVPPQKEASRKDVSRIKVTKVVVKKRRSRSCSPAKDGGQEETEQDQPRERSRDRDRRERDRDVSTRDRKSRSSRSSQSVKSERKVKPHFTITLAGAPPIKPSQEKPVIQEEDDDEDDFIMGGGTRAGVVVTRAVKPEETPALLPSLERRDGDPLPAEIQNILDTPVVGTSLGGGGAGRAPELVRCRYWPQCTKEDCPFHHPKEICPYYPACRFGFKCLYIHVVGGRGRGSSFVHRGGRGRGGGGSYVEHSSFAETSTSTSTDTSSTTGTTSSTTSTSTKEAGEAAEFPVAVAARGRGGYRGRGRGGAANVSRVFDPTGIVCRYDTFCKAVNCPYQHPVREKQEQNFLESSEAPVSLNKPSAPASVVVAAATTAVEQVVVVSNS